MLLLYIYIYIYFKLKGNSICYLTSSNATKKMRDITGVMTIKIRYDKVDGKSFQRFNN